MDHLHSILVTRILWKHKYRILLKLLINLNLKLHLPAGYYRQLPKLRDGPLAGSPRVFGLAWAYVAHTDSRFDPETLTRFVRAYQTIQPLTIGELWAVAITLRLVLVENLRRAATRIMNREQLRRVIQHYERITRHGLETLPLKADVVFQLTGEQTIAGKLKG